MRKIFGLQKIERD